MPAQSGYVGPGPKVQTIEEVKKLRDDTPVTLIGIIERQLGGERYMFVDNTGYIIIEIDERLWQGNIISETDKVQITGELDKDFNRIEIDVSNIKLII